MKEKIYGEKMIRYFLTVKEIDELTYEVVGIRHTSTLDLSDIEFEVSKLQVKEILEYVKNDEYILKIFKKNYNDRNFVYVLENKSEFEIKKAEAQRLIEKHYKMVMNSVALFEMYNVMMINNELGAQGHFITSDNREEKYIDIINSGDENLITLLQEYLEMKDRIDPMWTYYNKLKEFKLKLKDVETSEEVDEMIQYITEFIT